MEIVDSHVHLGLNAFALSTNTRLSYNLENRYDDFLRIMKKNHVSAAITLPIPDAAFDVNKSHKYLVDAYEDSNGSMMPVCRFNEDLSLNLCGNFYGVKYHMVYEDEIRKGDLLNYLKQLEFYGYPLIVHAKFKDKVGQIEKLLSIAPKLKIVLAHMGRGHLYTSEGVLDNAIGLKKYDNVFFETSTVGNSEIIEKVSRIIGSKRILYGSDYPFGKIYCEKLQHQYSYKDELSIILEAKLTSNELEDILGKTAVRIFSIGKKKDNICVSRVRSDQKTIVKELLDKLPKEEKNFLAYDKKRGLIRKSISEGNHVYVCSIGSDLVGYMRESGRYGGSSMLEELVVFENFRHRKFADRMIDFYLSLFPDAYAKTNSTNIKMNTILERHGFKRVSGIRILNWERVYK